MHSAIDMAGKKPLKTHPADAIAGVTHPQSYFQSLSGPYEIRWISFDNSDEADLHHFLWEHRFGISEVPLSVPLGYNQYELMVKGDCIDTLKELVDMYTPFHEDSVLVRLQGRRGALRSSYNAYKTHQNPWPGQRKLWTHRIDELKARLPELDAGSESFPYSYPY
jgi:hypothetical protein